MTLKLIFDPIHGNIKMDSLCLSIIDTTIFKRLQNIKQLGTCSYVFPGACHTRYSHSLGVAHLAEKMLSSIQYRQPELNISDRIIQLVKIAGLSHDLGHGPFSHTFDNHILPQLPETIREIALEHEERSIYLLNKIVKDNNLEISDDELEFISLCIIPDKQKISLKYPTQKYLFQIISNELNGIDVDKFDYLKRDPYMIGLDYSFDCQRILDETRIIDGEICFPEKFAPSILQMFSHRYQLHRQVCHHPVVKSIEYMIRDILLSDLSILEPFLKWEKFHYLTDQILFMYRISVQSLIASKLIERLETRQLYNYLGEIHCKNDELFSISTNGLNDEYLNKFNLNKDDIYIQNLTLSYSNTKEYPLQNVGFFRYNEINTKFLIYRHNLGFIMPNQFYENKTLRFFNIHDENQKKSKSLFLYLLSLNK